MKTYQIRRERHVFRIRKKFWNIRQCLKFLAMEQPNQQEFFMMSWCRERIKPSHWAQWTDWASTTTGWLQNVGVSATRLAKKKHFGYTVQNAQQGSHNAYCKQSQQLQILAYNRNEADSKVPIMTSWLQAFPIFNSIVSCHRKWI
jgi:hypothetical protein